MTKCMIVEVLNNCAIKKLIFCLDLRFTKELQLRNLGHKKTTFREKLLHIISHIQRDKRPTPCF